MQNRPVYEWGDIKFFLATASGGSTLAAARALGVSQPTVARRIAALEAALSASLFDRNQKGYRLTGTGVAMLPQAQRMCAEAAEFERLIARHNRELSGVVRVTTVEGLANAILTPLLSQFIEQHAKIKVEIITSECPLDLARGEADVALHRSEMPTERGITVRKLADNPWALFCSARYAAKYGAPESADDLDKHIIIGSDGHLAKLAPFVWLARTAPEATVRTVCNTVSNAMVAIKAGHGVGPLPCSVKGFRGADLIECFNLPQFKFGYYLLTRTDVKDSPHVTTFTKFIVSCVPEIRRLLAGGRRNTRMLVDLGLTSTHK